MTENQTKIIAGMDIQEDVLKLRIENEQLKAQNKQLKAQNENMKCCDNCEHWNSSNCKKARKVYPDNPRKIRACDENMAYWELREDFKRFSYDN